MGSIGSEAALAQLPMIGLREFRLERQLILLDLEFTCWEDSLRTNWSEVERPPEVIEVALVAYDPVRDAVSESFTSFVRPSTNVELSRYCTGLLYISQSDIDQAPPLKDVLARLAEWVERLEISGVPTCSWGVNDRVFLAQDAQRSGCGDPFRACTHADVRSLYNVALRCPPTRIYDRDDTRRILGFSPNHKRHSALADALDLVQFCRELRDDRTLHGFAVPSLPTVYGG